MYAKNYMLPSREESGIAREAKEKLLQFRNSESTSVVNMPSLELPKGSIELLIEILRAMEAGQAIQIIPVNAELTTVQAAGVLNVSRPFFIKLLEQGEIPYRVVGTHRRVLLDDVLHYKEKTDRKRRLILDELAAEAQELGLGYTVE